MTSSSVCSSPALSLCCFADPFPAADAVGVGAKANELQFTYEDAPNWHAYVPPSSIRCRGTFQLTASPFSPRLPTYPLVLGLKGDNDSVVNFANIRADKPTPGLPKFDAKKVVHAEQSIEILGPLPNESGKGWTMNKKLVGIKDTGCVGSFLPSLLPSSSLTSSFSSSSLSKGLIIDEAMELLNPQKQVIARLVSSSYNFGDFGKKGYAKSVATKQPIQAVNKPPQRSPDFTFTETITQEQATIYRLSGDYNPLHIDDAVGAGIGFGGVILHGLCTSCLCLLC